MASFCVPEVGDNPDGWGPIDEPAHLKNVPYAPFSKNEKLGKIADFALPAHHQKHYGRGGQHTQGPLVFNLLHNEQDENFHLVDSKPSKPPGYRQQGAGARRQQQQQRRGYTATCPYQPPPSRRSVQKRRWKGWRTYASSSSSSSKPAATSTIRPTRVREAHALPQRAAKKIRPEWHIVEQVEFSALTRLPPETVPEPVDLYTCGQLEYCDKSHDLCTPKTEKPIYRTKRIFHNVTASDDPIMRKFAAEDKGHVFVTDSILTAVMCAPRSIYSWDIVITKVGDKLFFDKRDQASVSLLTINETAPDPVPEDKDNINGVQQLSIEATVANQNFSQHILKKGQKCSLKNPSPFVTDGAADNASCGYKYRKWSFHDGQMDVIVRCEIDALQEAPNRPALVSTKAFVECCQRQGAHIDWRQRLESQRGAIFATELKNNGNKIAKWTAAALLANVDLMKFGYVSRVSPKDNHRHALLGMQYYKPKEFAEQIGLKIGNCWATMMKIVDLCMQRTDGKYLLLKEPNRPLLRLFAIPGDAL